MLNLLMNDFSISKRNLLFIFVYNIIFIFLFRSGMSISLLLVLSVYMVLWTILGVEERDKIDLLHKTLPVKAGAVVGAKYVEGLILWAVVAIFDIAVCSIARQLVPEREFLFWSVRELLFSLILVLILCAVSIPMAYKMGVTRSRIPVMLSWVFFGCLAGLLSMVLQTQHFILSAGIFLVVVAATLFSWKKSEEIYRKKVV